MNRVKEEFNTYKTFIELATREELITFMKESYQNWEKNTNKEIVKYVLEFHQRFRFWGNLDPAKGDYELIKDRARVLKEKWEDIEKLYNELSDYRSKDILIMILEHWLTFTYDRIEKVREHNFKPYFDMDLIDCHEEEVFADLGAWKGDTIEDYMTTYGEDSFKKIYSYEILPTNLEILKEKFEGNKRISISNKGVSDKSGVMYLSDNGSSDAQSLVKEGSFEVKTTTLDEDIPEKITFIKMDIEGSERAAIAGAREHIKKDHPKMAISIYHSNEDLVEIYKLIKEIQPNYNFYLRYYGLKYFPTDYLLICVPK